MITVVTIVIVLVACVSFYTTIRAIILFAPWAPSRIADMPRLQELAALKNNELFYDLGCGNGRILFALAPLTAATLIGIEYAFPIYCFARLRQWYYRYPHVHIYFGDLFKRNLSNADVVYFFGMPNTIEHRLKQKLEQELKPGTRVISYAFAIKGWTPAKKDKPSDTSLSMYYYVVPDRSVQP